MSSPAPAKVTPHRALQRALLAWYSEHRRDLPWRRTRDPYAIWVSEIMLQQTRVAAVVEKYAEFMKRFPTVQELAAAPLDNVLTVWSGLGYYRRARALHQAAKTIAGEMGGQFPTDSAGWRELPGIGRYTSAAIASIAFQEPIAVVDGNVERVLERLFAEQHEGERLWGRAAELLAIHSPGDWNQAMMELGATVCTPQKPQCLICPIRDHCATKGVLAGAPKPRRKRAELWYALHARNRDVFLVQRSNNHSLMAGMWELPSALPQKKTEPLYRLRHSITDTDYAVHVVKGRARKVAGRWLNQEQAHQLPLTGLTRKILRLHFARERT